MDLPYIHSGFRPEFMRSNPGASTRRWLDHYYVQKGYKWSVLFGDIHSR